MKKIAITGGIGSGKTTISKFFEHIGIPVYYSDKMAKDLMNTNTQLKEQLVGAFGSDCYDLNGRLNTTYLSKEVFSDSKKLLDLNSIVHPAVMRDYLLWANKQNAPYVILESAILFDIGWEQYFDKTIAVTAPNDLRVRRVMKRDSFTREEVQKRIDKQLAEEIRLSKADYVVVCDDEQLLIPQILKINKEFRGI